MRRKVLAGAAALLTILALRMWMVDSFWVSSDSMSPTLCAGDMLIVRKLNSGTPLAGGDIVVFSNPDNGSDTVKRVVGLPGQRVGIADAQLMVDGRAVDEPYVDLASIDGVYFGPVTVPPGTVFVMGDNRELSIDSRSFGALPREAVHDKLWLRLGGRCG
jgi:signal peptidase I